MHEMAIYGNVQGSMHDKEGVEMEIREFKGMTPVSVDELSSGERGRAAAAEELSSGRLFLPGQVIKVRKEVESMVRRR